MPLRIDDLKKAASRRKPVYLAKSFSEALAKSQTTAFLCHSHKDDELADGLQVLLTEHGWDLYIDWQDTAMPATPDAETARRIKVAIAEHEWFLFLATPNSTCSRWCPWEIGVADSKKSNSKIILIRTIDENRWYGNEYLNLYQEITMSKAGKLAVYAAGSETRGTLLENFGR